MINKKEEMLLSAIRDGKINFDDILNEIDDMNRDDILAKHGYTISPPSYDDRWRTYVEDASRKNNRRLITSTTEDGLNEKIIDDYKRKNDESNSVGSIFEQWLEYALGIGDITQSTVDRYIVDYNRLVKGSTFEHRKVANITNMEVVNFVKSAVSGRADEDKITKKCFSNFKSLLSGIFIFAKMEKGLDCIPIRHILKDIKISDKQFKYKAVKDEEQVYDEDEVVLIADYILDNYENTKDLGILYVLLTGLRLGEVSTLKPSDSHKGQLSINRTEVREKDKHAEKDIIKVREFPKNEGSMVSIELTNSALMVWDMIEEYNVKHGIKGEYLFVYEDGRRIRGKAFGIRLKTICKKIGIPYRSMHKLRKTYASCLFASGVEEKIVQSQMRHKNPETTHKHYEFFVKSNKEKRKRLNDVKILDFTKNNNVVKRSQESKVGKAV